jgi:hypothetical protein
MENKTGKYLKYAIGEIVLVVIGILIALQINNWNKDLQNKTLERKTLENFKIDLILQKEIIQSQLNQEKTFVLKVDSCLTIMNTKINFKTLERLLDSLSVRQTFISNKVTFENLGLDGNTSVITNSDLQQEIVRYYQLLDYTMSVINNNNLFRTNSQFGIFVVNNTLGFRLNNDGQIDMNHELSPEQRYTLKKQLDGRKYSSVNNIEKCVLQMNKTEALIQLFDNELQNKTSD